MRILHDLCRTGSFEFSLYFDKIKSVAPDPYCASCSVRISGTKFSLEYSTDQFPVSGAQVTSCSYYYYYYHVLWQFRWWQLLFHSRQVVAGREGQVSRLIHTYLLQLLCSAGAVLPPVATMGVSPHPCCHLLHHLHPLLLHLWVGWQHSSLLMSGGANSSNAWGRTTLQTMAARSYTGLHG